MQAFFSRLHMVRSLSDFNGALAMLSLLQKFTQEYEDVIEVVQPSMLVRSSVHIRNVHCHRG